FVQRAPDVGRILDADRPDAETSGDGGEIRGTEAQHLGGVAGLVALHADEIGPAPAEARIVVDDERDGNPAPLGGLQLGQVLIKRAIAAEAYDLAAGRRALGAERRRERPAERAGGAQVDLAGAA